MNYKTLMICLFAVFTLASCSVDQTQKAKLPDVDVDVSAGQMPEFDVDWASVDVGTRTETITVPKLRVVMEEETIEVPYVDVDLPNSGDKEELTLIAEAEISGTSHKIDIKEVYATGKKLYVISELTNTGKDMEDERMRVSDRLILNAPDLDVKHYIIGSRPDGQFNRQYSYVASKAAIASKMNKGKLIYQKK